MTQGRAPAGPPPRREPLHGDQVTVHRLLGPPGVAALDGLEDSPVVPVGALRTTGQPARNRPNGLIER